MRIKSGLRSVRKYQGKPAHMFTKIISSGRDWESKLVPVERIRLRVRKANHIKRHPNDKSPGLIL